jgi:hypothetical protein
MFAHFLLPYIIQGSPDKKNGKFWAAQAKRLGGFSKTKKFQNASHLKILVALSFLR